MNQHESNQLREATILTVSGMTCGGCANTVARILSRIPGVAEATVDFKTGRATIKGVAAPADLIAAVEAAGYGAKAEAHADSGDVRGSC
ncbi:MAG: heavy-metal-associated domain-containing protein [Xanthomonadaceae bacterium]|nr:heavy-metal-associated domain-containing protein [Xanthomonadaceae bacterium]MDE2278146.1 heavy-metal-associated domain-containing protein [Xanthomonadaceae bacterium]MDE2316522.1 heavy-metal-associated domain-containing protein [Xanthomonadaceae bacterium]